MIPNNKVLLIIRDGWGYSKKNARKIGNAVKLAKTPNIDSYEKKYPFTLLKASGKAVGLPSNVEGGSEVGHYTIGAGRIVLQEFEHINKAIASKGKDSFFKNKTLLKAIKHIKKNKSNLHLIGLFSDEGVHATTEHLYALLKLAKQNKVKNVYVHAFLDGRDTPEKSASKYFKEFDKRVKAMGANKKSNKNTSNDKTKNKKQEFNVKIASIVGRYYAMDRDRNWKRTQLAYELLTFGKGYIETDTLTAMKKAYRYGAKTDYYVKPMKMKGTPNISDKDAVIFWNFRTDRARQLTHAFVEKDFNLFRVKEFKKLHYVCMTNYEKQMKLDYVFPETYVKNNLGAILAKNKLKQLRIAETEKFAHVTFFFNSQLDKPNKNEVRIPINSPRCADYSEKPEMSALKVTTKLITQIKTGKFHFIALNFANGDLVGHSGNLKAAIQACNIVDKCIGKIVKEALKKDYVIMITGDHGNCEEMKYANGEHKASHTLNQVQFSLISKNKQLKSITLKKNKGLANITPTILELMGIKKPKDMTDSLIK
ncbi:2,3-bisphosphoglycerate-independent phosphoglycerate mutase [Candidatus Woesearchaeota archaeon]|jgi:2,3-bisphosphoglycerate-independent phosphoglycerate mutase|nr:2,3-bisphosphoglycerate-independent phosphoglycerate mutase [Candidatus Woesearchaeota archaeon]